MKADRLFSAFSRFRGRFDDYQNLSFIRRESLEILDVARRLAGSPNDPDSRDDILSNLQSAKLILLCKELELRRTRRHSEMQESSHYVSDGFEQHAHPDSFRVDAQPDLVEHPLFSGRSGNDDSPSRCSSSHADERCDVRGVDGVIEEKFPPVDFASENAPLAPQPLQEQESVPPPEPWKPDTRTYKAVIELMDLLDKARTDERMGPERMIRNLARKREPLEVAFGLDATDSGNQDAALDVAQSLLEWISHAEESPYEEFLDGLQRLLERTCACLSLERIDRRGPFDVADQHILEMVDTDDPGLDQTIEGTVECGYRIGDWVLRPQKVFVYRFVQTTSTTRSME